VASGTLTAFRQTGSVLGVALFGSLLAGMGSHAAWTRRARSPSAIVVMAALNLTNR
jgi:DHA2 family methylenomycin A resistance protein-like MFS transporter